MVIPGLMVSINEAIPPACRTHSNQSLRTLSVRIQAKESSLKHLHTHIPIRQENVLQFVQDRLEDYFSGPISEEGRN